MSSSPPHPTPPHPTHPTPPEAVHCVALWTRITLCFGHVSSMTQKSEKTMHFWEKIKRVSQLWQRQKHCSQWYECWVWVLGHTCCRNPVKRCLICPKTCVSYGEYMMKNARDQAPGRNNQVFHCSTKVPRPFLDKPATPPRMAYCPCNIGSQCPTWPNQNQISLDMFLFEGIVPSGIN